MMIDGKKLILAGAAVAVVMAAPNLARAADSFQSSKVQCPPFCNNDAGGRVMDGATQPPAPPPPRPPGTGGNGGNGGGGGGGGHGGHGGHGDHGGGGRHWNGDRWWNYGNDWQPDYYVTPRYYYNDPYYYEPAPSYYYDEPVSAARISCAKAERVLRKAGYRAIKATDCRGTTYSFRAIKGGKSYKVNVSARTGRILSARR